MGTLVETRGDRKARHLLHALFVALGVDERPPELVRAAQAAGALWAVIDERYPEDPFALEGFATIAIELGLINPRRWAESNRR